MSINSEGGCKMRKKGNEYFGQKTRGWRDAKKKKKVMPKIPN